MQDLTPMSPFAAKAGHEYAVLLEMVGDLQIS
jgi:hypothetical protein